MILSRGGENTLSKAMVSSTTPRLDARCPPVELTVSRIAPLTSSASADSRAAKPHGFLQREQVTDATIARVRRLGELAAARGQTLAQLALAWVLRDPRITTVLIGASSIAQLEQNLACLDRRDFGLTWNAAVEGGGILVGHRVDVHLDVSAVLS